MKSRLNFTTLKNQLRQFMFPFFLFLIFWGIGILIFAILEKGASFWQIMLISICVEESSHPFYNFYQFLWPLLFELLVLAFVLSTLQEFYGYNPEIRSRKIASHKRNHTVVLGYNHLGARIVEYLRQHKQPYSLVEKDSLKVDDLISFNEPVVVGDYTDVDIMKLAAVHRCKEVICVTTDLRRALVAAEKVRELNAECCLYMRVFDEHFREYLTSEPWNAFTFSISKWAMDSVKEWCVDIDEDSEVIVLGNDTIVTRIVEYYSELKAKVFLIDPEIDPEIYNDIDNVIPFDEKVQFLANLEERCNMMNISQVYICWNTGELFSDAIILTLAIRKKYPHIGIFVRIFDEELAAIAKSLEATTFSTSAYAFKMLQKEVKPNSGIYPINQPLGNNNNNKIGAVQFE